MQDLTVSPYESALDRGNAYWMAKLSQLVYRTGDDDSRPDEAEIRQILQEEDGKFEKVWGFDRKSSQGMIVEHNDFIGIVFRGTDEWRDWLDNLDIEKRETPIGTFHEGFWEATEDVWTEAYRAFRGAQHAQKARGEPKRPLFYNRPQPRRSDGDRCRGKTPRGGYPFHSCLHLRTAASRGSSDGARFQCRVQGPLLAVLQ